MRPTRLSILLLIAAVFAAVTWAALRGTYTSLPPLPWSLVPALLIAAAAETWTGRDLRARIAGRRAHPAQPLYVARMLVLAKASSQVAAVFAGVAAGFVVYLSGMLGASAPRSDMITASMTLVASLLLTGAALFLEYCCRVPKPPGGRDDRQDRDRDSQPPSLFPNH